MPTTHTIRIDLEVILEDGATLPLAAQLTVDILDNLGVAWTDPEAEGGDQYTVNRVASRYLGVNEVGAWQ